MSKSILAISSSVIHGHVGNSASTFALQRLGFEVWPIPTVTLAGHPGHGRLASAVTPPEQIDAWISGLEARGWLGACEAVLTGYFTDAAQVSVAHKWITRLKGENPDIIYCCDPIMGDTPGGLYVNPDVAEAVAKTLVPLADILVPNAFELNQITEQEIVDEASAITAARSLGDKVVLCTSVTHTENKISTVAITPDKAYQVETPFVDGAPRGTGDTLTALFLAETLKGADTKHALAYAVGAVYELCLRSAGAEELKLVEEQDALVGPVQLNVREIG